MMRISRRGTLGGLAAAGGAFALPSLARAQGAKLALPNPLAWTAYDVGSSGYNHAVAVGKALKDTHGIDLRVLPGKNDISRQVPLRQKQVQFAAAGVGGAYLAQEGVFEFGAKDWGPQEVRLLLTCNGDNTLQMGVAADAGIKTIADLKGKRVVWTVGAPALNENITAQLAFAGLTWADVKKVEFPGNAQGWAGVMNNQADAHFTSTTSGFAYQLQSSPRGLYWVPLPHDDKQGWKRLQAKGPYFTPHVATEGAGISPDKPVQGSTYPYPLLITYADQNADAVHAMTKAMVELYPQYKTATPGINGWAMEKQILSWSVPYHDGAIRYFKEIGKWADAHQANNDNMIKRQGVLKDAWKSMAANAAGDDKAFEAEWMKLRAARLTAAGFDPVYTST
jgi:TRAP transporter TAXI family solute receptor